MKILYGLLFAGVFTGILGYPYWKITHRAEELPDEPTNEEIRQSPEYRVWSSAVKKRDGWCIFCHSTENLEAHHIYSFASFPELRFELTNGITLCSKCHKQTPNYGSKQKTFDVLLKNQKNKTQ